MINPEISRLKTQQKNTFRTNCIKVFDIYLKILKYVDLLFYKFINFFSKILF